MLKTEFPGTFSELLIRTLHYSHWSIIFKMYIYNDEKVIINDIGEDGVFEAARNALVNNPHIRRLTMYLKRTNKPVYESACKLIITSKQINEINLDRATQDYEPDEHSLKMVFGAIKESHHIEKFGISSLIRSTFIGEVAASALNRNENIKHFRFMISRISYITDGFFYSLADNNRSLQSLTFENPDERVADFEVAELARLIRQNKTLRTLKYTKNTFPYEGGRAVADALKQNTTLIDVSFHTSWDPTVVAEAKRTSIRNSKNYLKDIIVLLRNWCSTRMPVDLELNILEYAMDKSLVTQYA